MALKTFDFPYSTPQDEYPAGATVKFGRGYRFASAPTGPDEVILHLNFPAMFAFQAAFGAAPDPTVEPQLNIHALEDFYKEHRMYLPFYVMHPRQGQIICRFNKPLVMPKPIKTSPGEIGGRIVNGTSWRVFQMEAFDLELLIQS